MQETQLQPAMLFFRFNSIKTQLIYVSSYFKSTREAIVHESVRKNPQGFALYIDK